MLALELVADADAKQRMLALACGARKTFERRDDVPGRGGDRARLRQSVSAGATAKGFGAALESRKGADAELRPRAWFTRVTPPARGRRSVFLEQRHLPRLRVLPVVSSSQDRAVPV